MTHEPLIFSNTTNLKAWPASPTSADLNAFSKLAKQNCVMLWTKGAGLRPTRAEELSGFWTAWSDGSFEPDERRSSIGGVVRDPAGAPIALFSRPSRVSEFEAGPLEAERSALLEALGLAADAGARRLEARFDCLPLLMRLLRFEHVQAQEGALRPEDHIAAALQRFDEVAFRWIPRGKNQLADALSKRPSGRGALCGNASSRQVFNQALISGEDFPPPTSTEALRALPSPPPPSSEPKATWAVAALWSPQSGWLSACGMLLKGHSHGQPVLELPKSKSLWWARSNARAEKGAIESLAEAFALRCDRDAPNKPPGSTFVVAINPMIHDWLEALDALPELENRLASALSHRNPGAVIKLSPDEAIGGGLEAMIWTQQPDPTSAFVIQERAVLARQGKTPPKERIEPPAKLTDQQRQERAGLKKRMALREQYRVDEALARSQRAASAPRLN